MLSLELAMHFVLQCANNVHVECFHCAYAATTISSYMGVQDTCTDWLHYSVSSAVTLPLAAVAAAVATLMLVVTAVTAAVAAVAVAAAVAPLCHSTA
jgi:hypothetical protein